MDGAAGSLDAHLRTLKERGANLLVLTPPATRSDCRRLLGDDAKTRRRLFVTVGGDGDAFESFADGIDPATVAQVAVAAGPTRAAAAATAGPSRRTDAPAEAAWRTRIADLTSLGETARAVDAHLSRFERADPAPAEVRLCLDSLDPLVEAVDRPELLRFLHALTHRVRAARGLGHVHLTDADERLVAAVEPLFEAVVEQRRTPQGLASRWRFRDADIDTDWIPLE